MTTVDIRRLDMTLLLIFSSILRTRQVTATAIELGVTQSSVSHALGRLRDVFEDPLFVRRSSGMDPTPRAVELEAIVNTIIDLSQQALAPGDFDPGEAQGLIRIGALDHHCALVAAPLIERLRHIAPNLKVSFRALARRPAIDAILSGKIDIGVGLFWNLPDTIERTRMWRDRWTVVGAAKHWSGVELTLEAYLAARHLVMSLDGDLMNDVDEVLADMGHERNVVATVPYFLAGLAAAEATDALLTVPSGVADEFGARFGLRAMNPPVPSRGFEMCTVRSVKSASNPVSLVVSQALAEIGRDLDRIGTDAEFSVRRGCGRMSHFEPENGFL